MEQKRGKQAREAADRETRLKAALKANLKRRKAQAKARSETSERDGKTK